jgi:3-deoxy-7-phosphoheptulonate synthase
MLYNTDDLRIKEIRELSPPEEIRKEYPPSERATQVTHEARQGIHRVLHGADDRLIAIVGPCSIHDPKAALEYALKLKAEKDRLSADLLILMRVYFEKPRTTVGWKGLINDPHLDGSFQINDGLRIGRQLLLALNEMGVPAGVEYLDMISPQYIADLVSWGAVGARTTESQLHRELASGLSCPVGFKNGTEGNVKIAVDAIRAAAAEHVFLSVTKAGHSAIVITSGNEDCHVILRGGKKPNYDTHSIEAACKQLASAGFAQRLMIDISHSNSEKDYKRQVEVGRIVGGQIASGDGRIIGVMVESHLKEGRQDLIPGKELAYGQSITDACIGWEDTVGLLDELAQSVRMRRVKTEAKD